MKANPMAIGALLAAGVLSGCASSPRTVATVGAQPLQATCNQATGSRVISSRASTDCGPVGYPFREIPADEFYATGQTNWGSILQSMR